MDETYVATNNKEKSAHKTYTSLKINAASVPSPPPLFHFSNAPLLTPPACFDCHYVNVGNVNIAGFNGRKEKKCFY